MIFPNHVSGGAWPFLVRGVICLVYSDNERDLNVLTRGIRPGLAPCAASVLCPGQLGRGVKRGLFGGALLAGAYERELLLRRIGADKVPEMRQ